MLKTVSTQLALASDTLPEVLSKGNTTGGTDLAVSSGDDITFADNSKAIFGAGSDISIYSDGATGQVTGSVSVSGNVGIGGSPSKPLHVFGPDGAGEGTPGFNANTVAVFQNNGTSADSAILNIVAGSASSGFIGFGSSTDDIRQAIVANMSDDSLSLRTGNNSTALTIDSAGDLSVTSGNLSFASGKGIDFSATAGTGTSELLDDYEEGEWTPVVRDDSSAGNSGSGTVKGFYTKIGRNVFINFSVSNLNTTGMTPGNDLFITGLPFTAATVTGTNYYTGALVMHSVTTAGNQAAAIQDATDYIKLYETVSGAAFEFITVGDISSGVSDIRFSLTYEAA